MHAAYEYIKHVFLILSLQGILQANEEMILLRIVSVC